MPGQLPRLYGFAIGEHYLVLEIDCPKAGSALGDSAAIGTWMLLRSADTEWEIIDVEGIPKQFWFALRTGFEKK